MWTAIGQHGNKSELIVSRKAHSKVWPLNNNIHSREVAETQDEATHVEETLLY